MFIRAQITNQCLFQSLLRERMFCVSFVMYKLIENEGFIVAVRK